MRFTRDGVEYDLHDDTIVKAWPWRKAPGKYYSTYYSAYFSSLEDYWKHVGAAGRYLLEDSSAKKMTGLSMDEVISQWVKTRYPGQAVVVLTDISAPERNLSSYSRIPSTYANILKSEVAIMHCNSVNEAFNLADSIPITFARAHAFAEGELMNCNIPGNQL